MNTPIQRNILQMKKIIISLAIVLLLILPFSYASVSNEDGEIISDSSSLKEGDRIILPDGAMYRIVQKEELTARLDEILPEITLKDSNRRMYRYKCIGVYGINREIADIASALENYGAAALTDESGLTPEEKAQKLSYSGASLLLGVKKTTGSEIRLTVLRTVSQKDAMLISRLALSKGNINCVIIQNPPAGQTVLQPRLILEIGENADYNKALSAAKDIGEALFNEAMQPDGSAQASVYIAPVCLGLIFVCFVWSFFRP